MSVTELMQEIRALSPEEKKLIVTMIFDSLTEESASEPLHDILEFEGMAAHLYDGTDAQEYINQLRSEWDNRP